MEESITAITSNPFFGSFLGLSDQDYLGVKALTFRNKEDIFTDDNGLDHFKAGDLIGCFNNEHNDGMLHWYTGHVGAIAHETKMNEEANQLMTLITLLENGLTRWIATKLCQPHGNRFVWEAGPYLYNIYLANNLKDDDSEHEYHLAFKNFTLDQIDANELPIALFTYWQGKRIIDGLDDCTTPIHGFDAAAYCKVEWATVDPALEDWMQQQYPDVPIYHALSRPITAKWGMIIKFSS
ncbi:MAG: hypothetical protein SGARI_000986 [Bacillariaceae sp.]